MKPAEASEELRTLTALFIANPKRVIALEMAIKRLNEEAEDDTLATVKRLFRSLTREQRESVASEYCECCWTFDRQCKCLEAQPDPIADWMNGHAKELEQYQGMHIAIHAEKGVVASGRTFTEVHDRAKELGLLDEVAFDTVPLFKNE